MGFCQKTSHLKDFKISLQPTQHFRVPSVLVASVNITQLNTGRSFVDPHPTCQAITRMTHALKTQRVYEYMLLQDLIWKTKKPGKGFIFVKCSCSANNFQFIEMCL